MEYFTEYFTHAWFQMQCGASSKLLVVVQGLHVKFSGMEILWNHVCYVYSK